MFLIVFIIPPWMKLIGYIPRALTHINSCVVTAVVLAVLIAEFCGLVECHSHSFT